MDEITPIFWQPTNAAGTAATVDTFFEDVPIKINFYWSILNLSAEPKTHEQLIAQIREMLAKHPLVDRKGKNVFHLERRGDQFGEIADPGWVPPVQA